MSRVRRFFHYLASRNVSRLPEPCPDKTVPDKTVLNCQIVPDKTVPKIRQNSPRQNSPNLYRF